MKAYYEKRDVSINESEAMTLYVVYTKDLLFEAAHPYCETRQIISIFQNEQIAIAVTNAINEGII